MPFNANGMSAMMIKALKMTAERMADLRRAKPHDVERTKLRVGHDEERRDDREIFGDIIGN